MPCMERWEISLKVRKPKSRPEYITCARLHIYVALCFNMYFQPTITDIHIYQVMNFICIHMYVKSEIFNKEIPLAYIIQHFAWLHSWLLWFLLLLAAVSLWCCHQPFSEACTGLWQEKTRLLAVHCNVYICIYVCQCRLETFRTRSRHISCMKNYVKLFRKIMEERQAQIYKIFSFKIFQ